MLYDEEFERNLPDKVPFENPWVIGICKFDVQKELRAMLERWFAELPDDIKPKFYSKLRSLNNEEFIPAFHELVLYRYCVEEGWQVEYEQPLDNGLTPDLMVHSTEHGDFIIEVTTLFDGESVARGVKRKEELTQKIGQIETNFVLGLNYDSYPPVGFLPKKILKEISNWLTRLSPEIKSAKKTFGGDEFRLEVEASTTMPKPSIGCVLSVMEGGGVPNYSTRVKRKLDEKRKKYNSKDLGIPVVVALADGVGRMRVDGFLIDRSLFGEHQVTIKTNSDEPPVMTRDRSGHFTPSNDATGKWSGKNTGISGVLFSSYRGSSEGFEMKVYHNPVAEIPLPYNIFSKMPQLVRTDNGKDINLNWTLGTPDNKIDDEGSQRILFDYDEDR